MTSLKPPNRWDIAGFPVFALSWFGDPEDGTSIIACSGGGGSAKTGVKNYISVSINADPEKRQISMGTNLGTKLHIYKSQQTNKIWLLAAVALEKSDMGGEIHRYSLPDCHLDTTMKIATPVSAITVNPMTDLMAVGCEDGTITAYALSDDGFGEQVYTCQKHTEEVCCLTFSIREQKLLSSAKDGTCLLWDQQNGSLVSEVTCEIPADDPALNKQNNKTKRKPRAKGNVIVRGCAFGDLEGNIFYSVASYRVGSSYLYRWFKDQNDPSQYKLHDRVVCTQSPVSAMSLSQDGGLLVMGTTESSVTLWGTADWRPLKVFNEVHGFLPTCAAARPFPISLQGEEDGVQVHARTGSGDGTIACLTLQKSAPGAIQTGSNGGYTVMMFMHRLFLFLLFCFIFSPVLKEAHDRCRAAETMTTCLLHEGFYTPNSKLIVGSRPY